MKPLLSALHGGEDTGKACLTSADISGQPLSSCIEWVACNMGSSVVLTVRPGVCRRRERDWLGESGGGMRSSRRDNFSSGSNGYSMTMRDLHQGRRIPEPDRELWHFFVSQARPESLGHLRFTTQPAWVCAFCK